MTNDGANSLTYDAENRAVTAAGASYTYDGNSLRVKKISGGTTTIYIFSGTKVIAEYSGTSSAYPLEREYIYSGSALLATLEGATVKYQMSDHLSARLTTDATGAVLGQQGHFPFGEDWYSSSATTKFRFTSYERDSESGNDYAMFRFYANRLARFSSPDPLAGSLADPQSLNRYAYTRNDPINLVDPLGLWCIEVAIFNTPNIETGQTNYVGTAWVGTTCSSGGGGGGAGGIHPPLWDDPPGGGADDKQKKRKKEVAEKLKKYNQDIDDCIAKAAQKRDQRIKRDRWLQFGTGLITLAGAAIIQINAVGPSTPPLVSAEMFTELAIHGHGVGLVGYFGYFGPLVGGAAAFGVVSADIGFAWNDYYKDVERCIASIPFPAN